jgi:DNA-directed RNA polymerase specialized sigma subunit
LVNAQEKLREYEAVIYSPAAPNLSGMPSAHGAEADGKITAVAQRHANLLADVERCKETVAIAGAMLDDVGRILDDREQEFLLYRYILGLSWDDTQAKMYHGRTSISRIRTSILQKIGKIEKVELNGIEKTCQGVL